MFKKEKKHIEFVQKVWRWLRLWSKKEKKLFEFIKQKKIKKA